MGRLNRPRGREGGRWCRDGLGPSNLSLVHLILKSIPTTRCNKTLSVIAAFLVAAGGVAGCGWSDGSGAPGITVSQAEHKARTYLEAALDALPSHATLVSGVPGALVREVKCVGFTNEDLGTTRVERGYRLDGLDSVPVHAVFAAMRGWWSRNGFRIVSDNAHEPEYQFILVINKSRFRMGVHHNEHGEFYLGVSSPCVRRDATPAPTTG
jgi:hypothetical protein